MARKTRSTELETRAARLRLPIRKKPYAVRIAPGIRLAYRRNETAGSWSVIVADGAGSNWMKSFGLADDHEEANGGDRVMDFWRAQDRARTLASGSDGSDDGRPVTVTEALDRYAADLAGRDGDGENVSRVRFHVPPSLASKSVSLLTARELRHWRDGMIKNGLKPATVKRTAKPLIAALNLAASLDPRITNGTAWKIGLASLPDSEVARNVVLPEDTIRKLVGLAYADSAPFGLLVEVAAVTGARVSQLRRLEVRDLIAGHRVMMPSSLKGKGTKRITRSPVPITPGLTVKLKAASAGRPEDAPLLLKADGNPWNTLGHSEPFRAHRDASGARSFRGHDLQFETFEHHASACRWHADPRRRRDARHQHPNDRGDLFPAYRRSQRCSDPAQYARPKRAASRERRADPVKSETLRI
jgi:integrase